MDNNWTKEFPTEPGNYWFYGYVNKFTDEPQLVYVVGRKTANDCLVLVGGPRILYKEEVGPCRWFKTDIPQLPNLQELADEKKNQDKELYHDDWDFGKDEDCTDDSKNI